jgi:5-methylcytosine-specific restriction enzyme A
VEDFDDLLQKERRKGRELRKSRWWQNKIANGGSCYYCANFLAKDQITMDHVIPISRGGKSTQGNIVMACRSCNQAKESMTIMEWDEYLSRLKQSTKP